MQANFSTHAHDAQSVRLPSYPSVMAKAVNNSRGLPAHIVSALRVNVYCIVQARRRRLEQTGDNWTYSRGHEDGTMLAYSLANRTILDTFRMFGPK